MPWTNEEHRARFERLKTWGFLPDEAWRIAQWEVKLNHFIIRGLRRSRSKIIKEWKEQGLSDEEIAGMLWQRWIDLGLRGQYEEEDWYLARAGVPA